MLHPKESHQHIWGGEGVVQGFTIKAKYKRRVPHFWMPVLKRTVVYSEVLDKHISVIVTDRTIHLINSNYGFDHYLLKVYIFFFEVLVLICFILVSSLRSEICFGFVFKKKDFTRVGKGLSCLCQ